MRKLLTAISVLVLLSCSYQDDNYEKFENSDLKIDSEKNVDSRCMIIEESSEGFLNNASCNLINIDPFTEFSNTFYFYTGNPNYSYFGDVLSFNLQEQIYNLYGASMSSVARPQTKELIISSQDYVFLPQIIDTSDIFPYISPEKANIVYEHCACKYVNQINQLQLANNGTYILEINYIDIQYTICGGPSNTHMNISYSIYKVTY